MVGATTGILGARWQPLPAAPIIMCMQYTLRNIPPQVDEALRLRAREEGRSLNEVAVEALARGVGVTEHEVRRRDLSQFAGTWHDDPEWDARLEEQRRIDEDLWK